MNQTISSAINSKYLLLFTYDGYARTVEPHAYGSTSKGDDVLRAYQVAGGHKSQHSQNWHLFSVSKMQSITTGASFLGSRPDYKRDDKAMEYMYAQL